MATAKERAAVGAEHATQDHKGIGGKAVDAVENVIFPKHHQAKHGVGNEHGLGNEYSYSNQYSVGNEYSAGNEYSVGNERGLGHEHGVGHEYGLGHEHGLGYEHGQGQAFGDKNSILEHGDHRWTTENQFGEGHHESHHEGLKEIFTEATKLPKEFETRIHVIQRYPEMRLVEETYYVKEIRNEERIIQVPKTRVVMEEHEHIDTVPVVREMPKKRIEIVHRVIKEEKEVVDMVPVIEYEEVKRKEIVPRIVTEHVDEKVMVPVVIQVPKTRMKEVHTGNYREEPAGDYVNPGHFNLLGKHGHGILRHHNKERGVGRSSSSSSSSDDEKKGKGHKKGIAAVAAGAVAGATETVKHKKKGTGSKKSSSSSSSSSSSDDEKKAKGTKHHGIGAVATGAPAGTAPIRTRAAGSKSSSSSPERHAAAAPSTAATTTSTSSAPSTPGKAGTRKKPSLLQRIEAKITG